MTNNYNKGFVLLFGLIIGAAVVTIYILLAESNLSKDKLDSVEFWHRSILYQIYPRSLYDSDGNGTGDLPGITSKADYFVELGVEMVWISPIFPSPMVDFGYDISNFTDIDPLFGTLGDFDNLVEEMHLKGIRVILDFVPNHSSDQHEWFKMSVQNHPKYKDYYVWKDPLGFNETGQPIPPNNWLSVFRYSAWEWSEERQQFYLHQFLIQQPDLNYRNPDVVEEMKNVLRFWLNRKVDGFRLDAVMFLVEVENVYGADEPVAIDSGETDPTQYTYLNHTYTVNQPETFDVIAGWRKVLDEYSDKVMMGEVYDDDVTNVMKYYGNETNPLVDFPFNFFLVTDLKTRSDVTGTNLKRIVDLWLDNMPPGKWPNWVLGNHDNGRIASKLGKELVDALNMFTLLLPGTPVTYYGEEIGMEDTFISYADTQDPEGCINGPDNYMNYSRDPERTPMQWDNSNFAGFTKGNSTWLPVNENYLTLNVKGQKDASQSPIKVYNQLALLRKESTFQSGELSFQVFTDDVLAFIRSIENGPRYLIVINTSQQDGVVDVYTSGSIQIPSTGTVIIRSSTDSQDATIIGSLVDLSKIPMVAGEGIVFLITATSLGVH